MAFAVDLWVYAAGICKPVVIINLDDEDGVEFMCMRAACYDISITHSSLLNDAILQKLTLFF